MKRTTKFFLLVTLAGALAHYLIVMVLSLIVMESGGAGFVVFPISWLLSLPMKYLILSPFGQSLSPLPYQMLFVANSVLWGLMIGTVVLWRKLKHE